MLRIFIPIAFAAVFLLYILYHLLIKKDLRQQRNNVFAGVAFMGIWALIYYGLLQN